MATENLYIPEEYVLIMCKVIRAGLKQIKTPKEMKTNLLQWCKEEEAYFKERQDD